MGQRVVAIVSARVRECCLVNNNTHGSGCAWRAQSVHGVCAVCACMRAHAYAYAYPQLPLGVEGLQVAHGVPQVDVGLVGHQPLVRKELRRGAAGGVAHTAMGLL